MSEPLLPTTYQGDLMRLRLLYLCTGTEIRGGIAQLNSRLVKGLSDLPNDLVSHIKIVSLLDNSNAKPQERSNCEHVVCSGNRRRFVYQAITSLTAKTSFLVVDHADLLPAALPHVVVRGTPTVLLVHGSEIDSMGAASRFQINSGIEAVVANSKYTARRFAHACPQAAKKVRVVHPGVMTYGWGVSTWNTDKRRPWIAVSARMDEQYRHKGHDQLLNIWPYVLRSFSSAQLVFIGDGLDAPRLQEKASRLDLERSVRFLGWMEPSAQRDVLARCRAMALPSRAEGFGLAYLDAMATATPCIGLEDSGAAEIIQPGITGLLIPRTEEALANAVLELLKSPGTARRLGLEAYRDAADNWSIEGMISDWLHIFKELDSR